jgi:hypothetical protein
MTVCGCRWWPLRTHTLNPKFKDISYQFLLLYKYCSYDYRVIFFMSKCLYIILGHSVYIILNYQPNFKKIAPIKLSRIGMSWHLSVTKFFKFYSNIKATETEANFDAFCSVNREDFFVFVN